MTPRATASEDRSEARARTGASGSRGMTDVIVEVGPGTVRGPNDVRADWVSSALECIDDDLTLIDDRPVSVAEVWREVLDTAVGGAVDGVVLVCPAWWSSSRIDLVCDAARTVATNVDVLQRTLVLREGLADRLATVVEIAAEFVVVSSPEGGTAVVMRRDDPVVVADGVAGQIGASAVAVVDAPAGVVGAASIGAFVADHLRATGIAVSIADEDCARRAAATWLARRQGTVPDPETAVERPAMRRGRRGIAVLAGAAMSVAALCGGFAVRDERPGPPSVGMPMTVLVEGRVGVKVPVRWAVQRITVGPGSARVQIISPSDADIIVHITQSSIPIHSTLATAADTLRTALAEQPAGVFVDFNPADRRLGKPAVTYREMRPDYEVAWTVLTDDGVRIAIGCQSGPGREPLVRDACDQAIQSAHAVF
jgi:type VII secretion-associated protein (TIGR03931 family)